MRDLNQELDAIAHSCPFIDDVQGVISEAADLLTRDLEDYLEEVRRINARLRNLASDAIDERDEVAVKLENAEAKIEDLEVEMWDAAESIEKLQAQLEEALNDKATYARA